MSKEDTWQKSWVRERKAHWQPLRSQRCLISTWLIETWFLVSWVKVQSIIAVSCTCNLFQRLVYFKKIQRHIHWLTYPFSGLTLWNRSQIVPLIWCCSLSFSEFESFLDWHYDDRILHFGMNCPFKLQYIQIYYQEFRLKWFWKNNSLMAIYNHFYVLAK